jgi:hypothetical protein
MRAIARALQHGFIGTKVNPVLDGFVFPGQWTFHENL